MQSFLNRIGIVLALPGLLAISAQAEASSHLPAWSLRFTCEQSNSGFADISSAAINQWGEQMPQVNMSLVATLARGADRLAGETISFTELQSNFLVLDRTSATTDGDGQCRVIVKGAGNAPWGPSEAYVRARYVTPTGGVYEAAVLLTVWNTSTSGQLSPAEYAPLLPGTDIRYMEFGLTKMASSAAESRDDYYVPTHIQFNSSPVDIKITWNEEYNPGGTYVAQTVFIPEGTRDIWYNMFFLDAQYLSGYAANPWARLGWRHHVRNTSNHELGHALLFGHNYDNQRAIMWPNLQNYFLWGTWEADLNAEWTVLAIWYP